MKLLLYAKDRRDLENQMRDFLGLDKESSSQMELSNTVSIKDTLPELPRTSGQEGMTVQSETLGPPTQEAMLPTPAAQDDSVDSRGIPWDSRVHASGKTKVKSGQWKKRKGVEPALLLQVEGELMANKQVAQVFQTSSVVPPVNIIVPPVSQLPPTQAGPSVQVGMVQTPSVIQQPVVVQGGGQKQAHDLASFKATLAPSITKMINNNQIDKAYIDKLCNYFNVTDLWNLNDQQMVQLFDNFVANDLISKVG